MTNHELQDLLNIDRLKLAEDGRPEFNRLIFSKSPYLLQHARNPVNWHEWGDEAMAEAQERNLPLFVSIGYSTCHWCHVMAHESFENREVADILNRLFIPVKVDREERPDLDQLCMAACQAITGSGGWPLNCFLKPDGSPFYALTYLPREPGRGLPGFKNMLENIARLWQQQPDSIDRNASSLHEALSRHYDVPSSAKLPDLNQLAEEAASKLLKMHDGNLGGFGGSPKFPMPPYLMFLLSRNNPAEQKAALVTLRAMRRGGIWDQIGGGIHRYSTDSAWMIPHFEKMLYDQALVAYTSLEAFRITSEEDFLEMAENLFAFVLKELTGTEGGFYSGLDADSEGSEGACYLWTKREVEQILKDDAGLFCRHYGVTEDGNSEEPGKNALHIRHLATAEDAKILERARARLLEVRNRREQPLRDLKILTGWNGLMIVALARGAAITGNHIWLDAARRSAEFVSNNLVSSNGRLIRSWCYGPSKTLGFLEDYAFLGWGYLEMYRTTSEPADLQMAEKLCREALRMFRADDGGFLTVAKDISQLPLSLLDSHDGVTPAASSALAMNLVELAKITASAEWRKNSESVLSTLLPSLTDFPINRLWLLKAGLQSRLD